MLVPVSEKGRPARQCRTGQNGRKLEPMQVATATPPMTARTATAARRRARRWRRVEICDRHRLPARFHARFAAVYGLARSG